MTTVKFFGLAKDLAGTREMEIAVGASQPVREFWRVLVARHPALAPYEATFRLAVNREYAAGEMVVRDGDEVAVIPPVSGG